MTQPRRGSGGSAAGSSDVGSTAGRRRKSMPTEASVALRCLRATVTELEEAHEAIGALLRLNDAAAWQKQLEQKDASSRRFERSYEPAAQVGRRRRRRRWWRRPPRSLRRITARSWVR